MNTKHDFCPGCGAQVYPEEAQCPFCGRSLRTRFMAPVVVGLAGTAVALVSGALVWWVLSAPAPQATPPAAVDSQAAAPSAPPVVSEPRQAEAPPEAAPSAPPPVASAAVPAAVPNVAAPPVPAAPPPVAATAPAASAAASQDQSPFAPPPARAGVEAPASAAVAPPAASAALAQPDEAPVGDAESRRAFAKNKQDSFAQNGLDLQVSTSGPQDTVLTIKFNFSAKTAAELIVAGPFPKQCEQRGFKEILFQDPSGATWVYTIATQQMSVR